MPWRRISECPPCVMHRSKFLFEQHISCAQQQSSHTQAKLRNMMQNIRACIVKYLPIWYFWLCDLMDSCEHSTYKSITMHIYKYIYVYIGLLVYTLFHVITTKSFEYDFYLNINDQTQCDSSFLKTNYWILHFSIYHLA